MRVFIQCGGQINCSSANDFLPLHLAVSKGDVDMVTLLVENMSPEEISQPGFGGCTPLHIAVLKGNLDIVKCLIENGAKIDPKNEKNQTPLFIAVRKDDKDVVDFLTRTKKRKAGNEPAIICSSKDPCVICHEPRNELYVLFPCGHTSLCELCCINLTCKDNNPKCPSCREPINTYTKLFFQKPE